MHVSSTYRPQNQLLPQGNLSEIFSYTFSAKEKDSETSLSYFGARYYTSDLSVWLSVDPMAAKYPSLSPYVYCANNPVKLVDPNGEDYEVVVDHEKKTITICATYYAANNEDFKILQEGLGAWNSQSGKYTLKLQNRDKYKVNFELNAVLDIEGFENASKETIQSRGANFNAFQINDNSPAYEVGDRGITRNGHVCYVKSDAPFRTTIHEIGHTLGLGEFNGDNVMTPGGNSQYITKGHVMKILEFAGIQCYGTFAYGEQISTSRARVNYVYENFIGKLK